MPRISNNHCDKRFSKPWLTFVLSLIFFRTVSAQEQAFDYHLEETPAISWNRLPLFDARATAAGGISLMASPVFAAAFNPALIPSSAPRLGAGYAGLRFQAFQFWGVNQGVIHEESPLAANAFLPASLAGTWGNGKWRLAAGYHVAGILRFPDFAQRITYEYDQYWEYRGSFFGQEQTIHAAAAWQPSTVITLGFRLGYIWGKRRIETTDFDSSYSNIDGQWLLKEIAVSHRENNRSSSWLPSIGISLHPHSNWTLAAAFEYPLDARVQRNLEQSFDNPRDSVQLVSLQECRDMQKNPANLLCSTMYAFKLSGRPGRENKISLAAEARTTFWSSYRYEFFGEILPRDLRDTVETALGLEYAVTSSAKEFSINLGVRRDPQPLRAAATTLWAWSGGAGARLGRLSGNIGLVFYSGATAGFSQRHFLFVATIAYEFKGE